MLLLKHLKSSGASEKRRFAGMFDRLFDCLNVKNLGSTRTRTKNQIVAHKMIRIMIVLLQFMYCIVMQWLKNYIGYPNKWKERVDSHPGFNFYNYTPNQNKHQCIPYGHTT